MLAFLISSVNATCPARLIVLKMIIDILFGDECTLHLFNSLFNAVAIREDKSSTFPFPFNSFVIDHIYFKVCLKDFYAILVLIYVFLM